MDQEINQMIERIIPQMQKFWLPILIISVLMGLAFIIIGMCRFASSGSRMGFQRAPLNGSTMLVLMGIVLTNIPAALDTLAFSTMQQASMQELSYMPPAGIGRNYIRLAVYLIQLVGLCAFIRGWGLMGHIGNRGGFGRAATHIIGGAWAVNIIGFFHMLGLSFGGPIQQAVQFTFG